MENRIEIILERILMFFTTKKIKTVLIFCILITLANYIIGLIYSEISADASYYIFAAKNIYNGQIPYLDFKLGYTPLIFYILQLSDFLNFTKTDLYSHYLIILFTFTLFNSILIFKILNQYLSEINLVLFFVLLFLIQNFNFGGYNLVLEPIVVFWGLLAIYLITLNKQQIWIKIGIGIFLSLSFLSKQYGLGFLLVVILLSYSGVDSRAFIKNTIFIILGFLIPILILFIYLLVNGLSFNDLLNLSGGGNYGNRNFENYYISFYQIIRSSPLIIITPFIVLFNNKLGSKLKYLVFVLIMSIFIFSFQFYFKSFDHYYILIIPFSIFLSALIVNTTTNRHFKTIFMILMLFVVLLGLRDLYKNTKNIYTNNKFKQIQKSIEISKLVDKDSENVYCFGYETQPLFLLNNYKPTLVDKYGYSFGFEPLSVVLEKMNLSKYLIISKKKYKNFIQTPQILNTLNKEFEFSIIDEIIVLKRKKVE